MIDKVGQLLWAWFSCPRKSADKIVVNRHGRLCRTPFKAR